jgi:TMEM199 family protein
MPDLNLNISLEPHLLDVLRPLPSHLPPDLSGSLVPYLSNPPPPAIPYDLLFQISKWSRTPDFPAMLSAKDYTMIALLAGTKTSPERRFPPHIPKEDAEQRARERSSEDKKIIIALINAVLSVAGAGLATSWVAEGRGWDDEWVSKSCLVSEL